MMRIVSGFSPAGYLQYGKQFLDSFHKFWPKDVELDVYTEEDVRMPRGACWSLFDCEGVAQFLDRHRDNPLANGRKPNGIWRRKDIENGYSFRTDACKFCRQMFIPEHAAEMMLDGDILVWLDADVVTFANPPEGIVEDMLGAADLAYLGRKGTYSEIGFWAVRLNDRTRHFLAKLADIYRSDVVFSLGQFHSAYVFDLAREANQSLGMVSNNITPDGHGHVWFQSPLGSFSDHLKGPRKNIGRSRERVGA